MIHASALALLATLAASSAGGQQGTERVVEIPAPDAAAHVVKRAEPIYPPSALAADVEGIVRLRTTVATDGTVRTATLVRGPRLLAPAAIEAVKQWRYTPFIVDGRPVVASFDVEVPFVLPRPDGRDLMADSRASTVFQRQWEDCQRLLRARRLPEAAAPCLALPELAEKLPPDRRLERAQAHEAVGMLQFSRTAYVEALAAFQRALAVRQSGARADDADLGMAYQAVAWAHRMVGNAAEARRNYETAEVTLQKSLAWVDTLEEKTASSRELHEEFRRRYTRNLQTILTDLVSFLKQTGDTEAAAVAQLRLDLLNRPR